MDGWMNVRKKKERNKQTNKQENKQDKMTETIG